MSNDQKDTKLKIGNTTFDLAVIAKLQAEKDPLTKEKFVEMHKPKMKKDEKSGKDVPDTSIPTFAGDINAAWETIQAEIKKRGLGAKPVTV